MVAISAAAHVIDSFYGATKELVPIPTTITDVWEENETSRASCVFKTMKSGFKFGSKTNAWPPKFKWLYKVRDAALHYK